MKKDSQDHNQIGEAPLLTTHRMSINSATTEVREKWYTSEEVTQLISRWMLLLLSLCFGYYKIVLVPAQHSGGRRLIVSTIIS